MVLLIDAIHTLINSNDDNNMDSRSLNKELADYLSKLDDTVIILTNAWGTNYRKIRELLVDYSFETFTLENKPPKTDPEYWDHLILYYSFDIEDCFYLDHIQANLDTALELGIKGALFIDNTQAIKVLQTL